MWLRNQPIRVWAVFLILILSFVVSEACVIVPPPPHPPFPPPFPRPWPAVFPIETKSHRAEIEIRHNQATVTVQAAFHNASRTRIEGEYLFPVESDVVVTSFSMTANGKTLEAELLTAEEASRLYEETVRRMKDPGLLEFMGTRVIRARVYPIEPRSDVKIELVYSQVLVGDSGKYHFHYPLRSAKPPGQARSIGQATVVVDIESDSPIASAYCPTYEVEIQEKSASHIHAVFERTSFIPDKEFDFYYSLDKDPVGLSLLTYHPSEREDGFFYLTLAPSVSETETRSIPKDVLFVLDTSGSMAGRKIDQAKDAMKFCLRSLEPTDRFNVVTFSTTVERFYDGLVSVAGEEVDLAVERVDKIKSTGGTALYGALDAVLDNVPGRGRLGMVLLLTDGLPTVGNTNVDDILDMVTESNKEKMRFFVFGVGDDLNTDLLDGLAARTNGTREYVAESEDIEVKVSDLYRKISSPVLIDVAVAYGSSGAFDLYPTPIPDLFSGEDLVLLGRYSRDGHTSVTLGGRTGEHKTEQTFDVFFKHDAACNFIPRTWAGAKITHLLGQIRLNGPSTELVDAVEELGKQYGIVTPYTSLLILEDESPRLTESFGNFRRSFEKTKVGAGAVGVSKMMASASKAPSMQQGRAMFFLPEPEEEHERSDYVSYRELVSQRVQHLHDLTFYVDNEGEWVDSRYEPDVHGKTIREIVFMSNEYFAFMQSHPDDAKYLVAGDKLVLVIKEEAVRIVPRREE